MKSSGRVAFDLFFHPRFILLFYYSLVHSLSRGSLRSGQREEGREGALEWKTRREEWDEGKRDGGGLL